MKVIIVGPAFPYRGGLATFDHRLCREFQTQGFESSIFTFKLQYPNFLFPGKTQFSTDSPPENTIIYRAINSVNPLNWIIAGWKLKKQKPDLIIVRFWLPFMGPALGTILRIAKLNRTTKVIAITDNIIPHEKRIGDTLFTKYFLQPCDAFVAMSEKVFNDIKKFSTQKPVIQVVHPLYDNFGEKIEKQIAREKLQIDEAQKIILFFGFIRAYKGLDILLEAISILKNKIWLQNNFKLLIAGEFYGDEEKYLSLINDLKIKDALLLHTNFIADDEVKYYFCASDVVVQPYKNATQSGVTPLAYYYEKPMIVTNVGSLATFVPHEKVGLVCEPNANEIANAIEKYFVLGEQFFIENLKSEKQKFSWQTMVKKIVELFGITKKIIAT